MEELGASVSLGLEGVLGTAAPGEGLVNPSGERAVVRAPGS